MRMGLRKKLLCNLVMGDPLVHAPEDSSYDGWTRCGLFYPINFHGNVQPRWQGVFVEEPTTCLMCLGTS